MQSLDTLGWSPFFEQQLTDEERARFAAARVVWESRERYRLSTGDAEWDGQLTGRLRYEAASRADLPAVGDWVVAACRPRERSATIHRRLDRRSAFARAAAGRSTDEQIVAANIDTVLLVTSCNRDFNLRRMERYLALTWESGASPIIVVNKSDLSPEPHTWRADMASVSQGVPIVMASALRGDGMTELAGIVRAGGTTALLGSSGVGKSSLINGLVGEVRQDVSPIRDYDARGRHKTTARQLFCLAGGGVLIDTPGMRELQLLDADAGLGHAFADIETLAADCRFRNCTHGREPGCAVARAVDAGDLSAERLDSYHRLQREEEFLRTRHEGSARKERTRKAKRSAKSLELHYKLRRR